MEIKPEIRHLKEMENVVYDKDFAKKNPALELYSIYRGIGQENGIRYDETIIPGQMLSQEFTRTKGNRNSNNFGELYIVLEGEAIFLMQKTVTLILDRKKTIQDRIVKDVLAIKAQKGDYIIVPSDYAIIIINASKKELKTGNWVSQKNENIYKELEKMGGMCYFAIAKNSNLKTQISKPQLKSQNSRIKWVKNSNYKIVPSLRFEKPLKQKPKNLDFLKQPR